MGEVDLHAPRPVRLGELAENGDGTAKGRGWIEAVSTKSDPLNRGSHVRGVDGLHVGSMDDKDGGLVSSGRLARVCLARTVELKPTETLLKLTCVGCGERIRGQHRPNVLFLMRWTRTEVQRLADSNDQNTRDVLLRCSVVVVKRDPVVVDVAEDLQAMEKISQARSDQVKSSPILTVIRGWVDWLTTRINEKATLDTSPGSTPTKRLQGGRKRESVRGLKKRGRRCTHVKRKVNQNCAMSFQADTLT